MEEEDIMVEEDMVDMEAVEHLEMNVKIIDNK